MGTTSHGEKKVLVPIADGSEEMEAGKSVLLASPAGCRSQWHSMRRRAIRVTFARQAE